MMRPAAPIRRALVLVGGGHSHVQLLRRMAMAPLPADVRVTLVVDRPVAVYSGMVPGLVAGQYPKDAVEIDLIPLARRAGARVILASAVRVEAASKRLILHKRPPLRYDLLSVNIGSTVLGGEAPDVAAFALPTRPIGRFVEAVEARIADGRPLAQVVVVGAGAGGVELAFCLEARLRRLGRPAAVHLLCAQDQPLHGHPAAAPILRAQAAARGITLHTGQRVVAVEAASLRTDRGLTLPHDLLVWVTGAAAHPLGAASGLPVDGRGFIEVEDTLAVVGQPDIFAAGDCAVLASWPAQPRAGVYAVREGPILDENLRARLQGAPLRPYKPQRDFLALFNLGDGSAIAARNGLAFHGRWAFRLKDWIDRRFMARFQVLGEDGRLAEAFAMKDEVATEMVCGGCAAKVGADDLRTALAALPPAPADPSVLLGVADGDDVAAILTPAGDRLALSIDAFPAPTDDPYLCGKIAAHNALSDLWAKGARPRHALALVTLPLEEIHAAEALADVLLGAREVLDAAGVSLLGGHSLVGQRLTVGFAVLGEAGALRTKGGLVPGDLLLLTRPLGTGVLLHADMLGRARGRDLAVVLEQLSRGNGPAAAVLAEFGPRGSTDVTGFGLAGHLGELLRASGCAATVDLDALPALPGALGLLGQGIRSTLHPQNAAIGKALFLPAALAGHPALPLLFDPQTCGGLLVGLPEDAAPAALAALRAAGEPRAAVIGRVTPLREDGALFSLEGATLRASANGR